MLEGKNLFYSVILSALLPDFGPALQTEQHQVCRARASWHEYLILSGSKLREFLHPRSPEAAQVPGRGDRDDRGGGAGAAGQGAAQGRGGGRGERDEAPLRRPLRPGQGSEKYSSMM